VRDGIPGNTQTPEELRAALADEFADAVIYLDLAAQSQGFGLAEAIVAKFNRTSEKIGAPHRLRDTTGREPQP
jgi:NTP pyrophosphatase (non-canonical NTP hydrolase)